MTTPEGSAAAAAPAYTRDATTVLAAERAWLAERRAHSALPPPRDDLVGLAFSGGGIRSATFNLGVLQGLQAAGLMRHVDYLSSVSGGGYVASSYSWLRATDPEPKADAFAARLAGGPERALDWIRAHGKYLITHRGYSVWTLLGSVFAATLVNVLVLAPPLLLLVFALTLDWLPIATPDALDATRLGHGHHGYWLLLALAASCLAAFPPAALALAVAAGVPALGARRLVPRLRVLLGRLLVVALAAAALGAVPLVSDAMALALGALEAKWGTGFAPHVPYLASLLSGAGALAAGRGGATIGRRRLATIGLALIVYGLVIAAYVVVADAHWLATPAFLALLALSAALACLCDVNGVSMHAHYRTQIGEAFLPVVAGSASSDPLGFRLRDTRPETGAPLHLVNATLNMVSSSDPKARARGGASFVFSPLAAGSDATGWRRADDYARGTMALSTMATISGAAVDPDTAATRAPALSFLMALLNVRLGYWAENPAHGRGARVSLPWWWIFLLREMFGAGLDAQRRHVHLSDGGGFENLGLYELVRRRVRYAIVCDAGCDPQHAYADLGRAVERVRVDFGADVDLSVDGLAGGALPCRLGTIRYADGSRGELLYVKALLVPGAGADLTAYAKAHPAFPNESTANQFFDEPQFEAYRELGRQSVARLVGSDAPASIAAWFERLRAT